MSILCLGRNCLHFITWLMIYGKTFISDVLGWCKLHGDPNGLIIRTFSFWRTPTYKSPESILLREIHGGLDIWSLWCIGGGQPFFFFFKYFKKIIKKLFFKTKKNKGASSNHVDSFCCWRFNLLSVVHFGISSSLTGFIKTALYY